MERVIFTKEMKRTHTLLMPSMLPIHFSLLKNVFEADGYNMVLLDNCSPSVVETGLKYVQNDTCYPALLVIGQMIDALNSGKYDLNSTALIITQTGGGCRASNYIYLLRKALKRAGFGQIPVVSLNVGGMEKNPGFRLTIPLMRKLLAVVIYGDCLMLLKNQTKPYERVIGDTDRFVEGWVEKLTLQLKNSKGLNISSMRENLKEICSGFLAIERFSMNKIRVGIVGEIYVKYARLANNSLEEFLESEGCEIDVPGLFGFLMYCSDNFLQSTTLYGEHKLLSNIGVAPVIKYLTKLEKLLIDTVKETAVYHPPMPFYEIKEGVRGIIGHGVKMGEGWLLTAEMVELIRGGVDNIICTQPFGCLPNHISGKGMMKRLKELYPDANIVPIDYDPGATRVNQENRIKLMLSVAKEAFDNKEELSSIKQSEEKRAAGFHNA